MHYITDRRHTLPCQDTELESKGSYAEQSCLVIDREIVKHESHIQELKYRRNTLAPISRLPTEIFCRIFQLASGCMRRGALFWTKLSHVCRHWRTMAINCPTLWTNIPVGYRSWAEEMIRRSKNASLTVKADFTLRGHYSLDTMQFVLSRMDRIKDLSILNPGSYAIQTLLTSLPASAPRLETLSVSSPASCAHHSPVYTLSADTLSDTSRLRRVELVRCDVVWDSPILSSLTHLTIHEVSDVGRPTTAQLIDTLQRMPDLQYLDLKACLPEDRALSPLPKPLHLPHLRSLILSGKVHDIEPMLRRITIAPTSSIKITCKESETPGANFTGLLSLLSSLRPCSSSESQEKGSSPAKIRTLEIMSPMTGYISFKTFPGEHSTAALSWGSTVKPDIDVSLNWINGGSVTSDMERTLTEIYNAVPLEDLRMLHIQACVVVSARTIADTFGRLQRLHSTYTTGPFINPFVRSLTEDSSLQTMPESSPSIAFPALRHVSLKDFSFEAQDFGAISLELLQDCFVERYERGFEIPEVHITQGFKVCEYDVGRLREIVAHVEWDGMENGFSEDEYPDEDDMGYEDPLFMADHDYDSDYEMFPFGFY